MARRGLPWIYPYQVDDIAARDGRDVLRPIVHVVVHGVDIVVPALVDSGCDHVLIAPYIARALGFPTVLAEEGYVLGVGGDRQRVRPERVTLSLLHPQYPDERISWPAEVLVVNEWKPSFGVLLGQQGFFDRFTVTFHRGVQAMAIDAEDAFELRHGQQLADGDTRTWVPD